MALNLSRNLLFRGGVPLLQNQNSDDDFVSTPTPHVAKSNTDAVDPRDPEEPSLGSFLDPSDLGEVHHRSGSTRVPM